MDRSESRVSIPYEREGISKVFAWSKLRNAGLKGFNSLRTGRHIQRSHKVIRKSDMWVKFQFPTNGKAYPKPEIGNGFIRAYGFQFPTNGKAYPKGVKFLPYVEAKTLMFQFPTNGKAYPKVDFLDYHCLLAIV